jgi:predicted dehydrogenase
MKRRYFLGAAAAAAGMRTMAASDRVRLAMIGVGGRGRSLVQSLGRVPGIEIGWLCEVDQANLERATKLMAKVGLSGTPKTGPDMRKVLEDKSVDAVFITTPDHWHAPAAILAADAGKDVYVEKPCSHNIREGRLMLEAARRNNRVMQVGTQSRSRLTTIQAMEYARSGKIGKVLAAKAWNVQLRTNIGHKPDGPVPPGVDYDTWVGPAPWIPFNENRFHYNWHWHWNFGTGDIGNDGAHQIDQARWALGVGAPVKASGMGAKIFFDDDQQTPDTMNITYEYGDNRVLIWEMRIWNPYGLENNDNAMSIYGTDGMMQVGEWDRKSGFKVFDRDGKLVLHEVEKEGDRHLENFVECVRSRQRPSADIEIGHISTLHCHLGNIVARTGRNVKFDPKTEAILGDAEANALTRRTYREHWGTPKGV